MADTPHVQEIQSEEISIIYVCPKYPREVMKHLSAKGYAVEKKEKGIYYVYSMEFAVQIVVNPALSEVKNLWLKNLTNKITDTESVVQLVHDGLLSLSVAAERAQMSVEEFQKQL